MLESSKKEKIEDIISTVKLGSIVLIGIVFMKNSLGNSMNIYSDPEDAINFFLALLSTVMISGLYYIWSFVITKKVDRYNRDFIKAIESVLFFLFFMTVILATGKHSSQYKIIFLFVIIPVTIQFGMVYGLIGAGISSLYILIVDLVSVKAVTVNQYFEDDIITSAIFILAAWFLGYYVKLENDHNHMLEEKANLDGLTGLYNHRYFYDELIKKVECFQKGSCDVSLIFMDIDYFKEYNDYYGHFNGDKVLSMIGDALKETVGSDSLMARYGGDEFAVILTNKSEEQVFIISERIRTTIEDMYFEGQEHLPSHNLTVSIGIARCNSDIDTHVELIKCADDALYRAKFFKKNRVEVYSSILDKIKLDIDEEHIDLITSIKTLISVINAKDRYTYGHVERVVMYAKLIADKLCLSEDDKRNLVYGAYIHDIGKISISQQILNKKRPLTDEEWYIIKQHPINGVDIIKQVESLSAISPMILHHHERYDGSGYPDQLKGEEIPYLARILTVVDSFDAMTFNRPYKSAMTFTEASEELRRCSGIQFDPEVVESFIEVINDLKKSSNEYIPSKHYDHVLAASK